MRKSLPKCVVLFDQLRLRRKPLLEAPSQAVIGLIQKLSSD